MTEPKTPEQIADELLVALQPQVEDADKILAEAIRAAMVQAAEEARQQEREMLTIEEREDGYWLFLKSPDGFDRRAMIRLEPRGQIAGEVVKHVAAAIRARGGKKKV